MVPKAGLEPARGVTTLDFESSASANSATSATQCSATPLIETTRNNMPQAAFQQNDKKRNTLVVTSKNAFKSKKEQKQQRSQVRLGIV